MSQLFTASSNVSWNPVITHGEEQARIAEVERNRASDVPLREVTAEIPEDGEVTLSLRVTVAEAKQLLAVAAERDVSLTALLRSLVDGVLA